MMQEELEQTYLVHMFQWLTDVEKEYILMYLEGFVPNDVQDKCWLDAEAVVKCKRDIDKMLQGLDE